MPPNSIEYYNFASQRLEKIKSNLQKASFTTNRKTYFHEIFG